MNFRADYTYHVMNGANGKIVFSCDAEEDAKQKAETFAKGSGGSFIVLQKTTQVRVEKVVVWA